MTVTVSGETKPTLAKPCVFCRRLERSEWEWGSAHAVAFEPLEPVTPGHYLVIPRAHAASAMADPEGGAHAMRMAFDLAGKMGLKDANFITSAGKFATQTVFHTHVHIVPRFEGDELALPWTGQLNRSLAAELIAEATTLRASGLLDWGNWDERALALLPSLPGAGTR